MRELQIVLENTVMIRRTKDQVLKELPRKIRQQVFLKIDPKDLRELHSQTDALSMMGEASTTLEGLFQRAEYMAVWKRTGEVKLKAMLAYVEDLLDGRPQKILLFAHHIAILDAFEAHFVEQQASNGRGVKCIRIDGRTPPSDRQDLCSQFQRDDSIRLALLSITAASVGIWPPLLVMR